MSVLDLPRATVHPRHTNARNAREHRAIERRYAPSARELFPVLHERLLASRTILGDRKPRRGADGITTPLLPVYGHPTFRNVIEGGEYR